MSGEHTLLVTGGAGFIGSNFVRFLLREVPDLRIVNVDALTYAGNLDSLGDCMGNPRHHFVNADIGDATRIEAVMAEYQPTGVINFAAESHVDRSIEEADVFLRTNVLGTRVLLDAVRKRAGVRFLQISTDEVYGALGAEGCFTESTPLAPRSPYSASKAAADLMVQAFHYTHGLDTVITRCSNNYGPYQFPEKMIPLMICNAIAGEPLPLYGDGLHVRDWIHVRDHCRGVWLAYLHGRSGGCYNFGGRSEHSNLAVVRMILRLLDKPESLIAFVADRPGHDRRYAIDPALAEQELGWRPLTPFAQGLQDTVAWYLDNRTWRDGVRSGDYREYYRHMYAHRGGLSEQAAGSEIRSPAI